MVAAAAAVCSAATAGAGQRLPLTLADRVTLTVERDGQAVELALGRRSVRAPGFRLRIHDADGRTVTRSAPEPRTYRGSIVGDPASVVAGHLGHDGFYLRARTGAGEVWWIRPVAPGLHQIFDGDSDWPDPLRCGSDDLDTAPDLVVDDAQPAGAAGACPTSPLSLAQIAFDVDFPYYQNHGSDLAATIANVEGHLAVVDAHYARDALITYELTEMIVRTTRFYVPDASNNLLDLFRDEWNVNQTGVVRDITHLMTGQPAPGLAGLAYVAVTCNVAWAYGWSVDSAGVLSHELGHNWSAGHCHDTSPCNNMCGACLLIAANTKAIVEAFRDSRTCLDPAGPFSTPLEPYAHPDRLRLDRGPAVARSPTRVDVLGNDHDANCDPISIDRFDVTTPAGAPVARSIGTGPSGRDELEYTPPCSLATDDDVFTYVIDDATGGQSAAQVSVDVRDPGLVGYWTLDDPPGVDVADSTGHRRHGSLTGAGNWIAGPYDGALELNGIDEFVTVPALSIEGHAITITTWVRRDGPQNPWAALVMSRAAGTVAGLNLGEADELRYHWNGDVATWGWNSGLVVPDGVWASNLIAHPLQTFAGACDLGRDPSGGTRYLRGALDDIRVYDHALTPAQIAVIAERGGRACAPIPIDGGHLVDPGAALTWMPGHQATGYDVYFGSDWISVRDATPQSALFRGRQTATTFDPPGWLLEGISYAWRVDTVVGTDVVPGEAWLFRLRSSASGLAGYWTLDDGAGTTVADATSAGRDGTLVNGATWDAGRHGGAILLDGIDDHVVVPAIDLTETPTTITAWVRRDGPQNPWPAIFMSRASGTVAGLNLGDASELRYHWSDDPATWGFDSGLVLPDGVWSFTALVLEPGQATLWLHDGGALQSALNVVPHSLQSFTGEASIGRDPAGGGRYLRGAIDDVRIYRTALTPAQIAELAERGGPAVAPRPGDGDRLADAPTMLRFGPGLGALSHDLYLGADPVAVRDADTSSPEYRGSTTSASFDPGVLAAGTTTYWRVDERDAIGPITGPVWRFGIAEKVANSLLMTHAGSAPELFWSDLGNGVEYDVERCDAAAGPCLPAAIATVGPYVANAVDATTASEPILWYRIATTGACAP